jgi:hypothetical protein
MAQPYSDNAEIPPLEEGEGRQAQGDVPVGECRPCSHRDIPREPKRFLPPLKEIPPSKGGAGGVLVG